MSEEQFRTACIILLGATVVFYGAYLWDAHSSAAKVREAHGEMLRMAVEADLARRAGLE